MAIEIILVEDSADDVVLLQRAFKVLEGNRNWRIFEGGSDALRYLVHTTTKDKTPDLLVLDLHLPDLTGVSFLESLKAFAPHLKEVPIAVLSNHMGLKSQLAEDSVDGCFEKPCRYEGWIELANNLNRMALLKSNARS